MIARIWKGSAIRERADDYIMHLNQSVIPELKKIDGFRAIYLLRRESSDNVEFVVLTLWESMDAVRKFAGNNPEVAVVAAGARELFQKYDAEVQHLEIVLNIKSEPHK